MTSRTIQRNSIEDLQRYAAKLRQRVRALENDKTFNLPVYKSTEFPPGFEGDISVASDDSTGYIYSSGAWVGLLGGGGGTEWDAEIIKTTDESVSASTTLQDDDELFWTTTVNVIYEVELILIWSSPAGLGLPDIKFVVGEDTTIRGHLNFWSANNSTANAATATQIDSNLAATPAAMGTEAAKHVHRLRGIIWGNGGVWKVQWAQNTSNANATIVHARSRIHQRALYP